MEIKLIFLVPSNAEMNAAERFIGTTEYSETGSSSATGLTTALTPIQGISFSCNYTY